MALLSAAAAAVEDNGPSSSSALSLVSSFSRFRFFNFDAFPEDAEALALLLLPLLLTELPPFPGATDEDAAPMDPLRSLNEDARWRDESFEPLVLLELLPLATGVPVVEPLALAFPVAPAAAALLSFRRLGLQRQDKLSASQYLSRAFTVCVRTLLPSRTGPQDPSSAHSPESCTSSSSRKGARTRCRA